MSLDLKKSSWKAATWSSYSSIILLQQNGQWSLWSALHLSLNSSCWFFFLGCRFWKPEEQCCSRHHDARLGGPSRKRKFSFSALRSRGWENWQRKRRSVLWSGERECNSVDTCQPPSSTRGTLNVSPCWPSFWGLTNPINPPLNTPGRSEEITRLLSTKPTDRATCATTPSCQHNLPVMWNTDLNPRPNCPIVSRSSFFWLFCMLRIPVQSSVLNLASL